MKKLNPLQSTVGYLVTLLLLFSCFITEAQVMNRKPFPFEIKNHTGKPDSEVYVAIVGEDLALQPGPSNHVWVDCKTGEMKMMDRRYNTIKGPVYVWIPPADEGIPARNDIEGNRGPFGDAMYADCFTKLSDIPNKTIMLPLIQGCRVFLSVGSQLYLCFRGSDRNPGMYSGYTAPAITDDTDPNQGILWDMIELTYDQYGYFANTSRVDSYNYPMGMESWGQDMQWDANGNVIVDANGKAILVDSHKQAGENLTHDEIQVLWKDWTKAGSGREEFAKCLSAKTGAIHAPGKIKDFADGSVGTMPTPGPYVNYFKTYVDKVWQTYSSKDLVFDSGDAGVWTGRVTGETFTFTCNKVWGTGRGIITRKPTTQEVLEGKGCLDEDVQKIAGQQLDRLVQAQICAALNRHVIPVDGETLPIPIPTKVVKGITCYDFSQANTFYQAKPSNYYAAFWHQGGINKNDKAYDFCYDDVWNYASATPSFMPERVVVHLNGFSFDPTKPCDVLPTVNAGADVTVTLPTSTATLAGRVSDDLSRGGLTYSWRKVSGPAGGELSSTTSLTPSLSNLLEGTYTYELSATIATTCTNTLTKADQVVVNVSKVPPYVVVKCGGEASGTSGSSFQWEVDNSATPTVTFIPITDKSTKPVVFLYSVNGVDKGGWNNFNGMNITLSGTKIGDKVKFYYVYTIPQGGEANNLANMVEFEVGQECTIITAIKSVKESENEVTLYPNPASRQINIKVPEETFSQIQIINTTGSIVYMGSIESEEATFDIEELPRGIYFVKLIGETSVTKKFIKK